MELSGEEREEFACEEEEEPRLRREAAACRCQKRRRLLVMEVAAVVSLKGRVVTGIEDVTVTTLMVALKKILPAKKDGSGDLAVCDVTDSTVRSRSAEVGLRLLMASSKGQG
ncbi:hypothetical protein PIB30_096169 [Stylosanthes scabra]|uniref:Uncharacterized protein n=1 Tax=Stylosanthes scabra TaxID=79078 RepID=A0ABU6WUB3_9FABA|nr:hypothetical protein [Stylosanthes scabra]